MSETQGRSAELHAQSSAVSIDPSSASAGQLMRQARERKGISIEALAASLKVPADKLKALEDDNWSRMPDNAFTRSLSLSICRVLQMDPATIMDKLPKAGANRLSSNPEGINTPFKERALQSSSSADAGVWKIAAVLLIAAVALLAWYWLPQWWQDPDTADVTEMTDDGSTETADTQVALSSSAEQQPSAEKETAAAVVSPVASSVPPAAASVPAVSVQPQPVTPAVSASVAAPGSAAITATATATATDTTAVAPAANAAQTPSSPTSTTPTLQSTSETDTTQETTAPVLRIKASGETWVQVRNAQRRVVAEKILKTGDVLETNSKIRPLSVVIGRADLVTVEVEGAAFALPRTRDNVARFEVK